MKPDTQYKIVTCNACKQDITIAPGIEHNRQSDELMFRYFVCQNCGAAFLIGVTDKHFRRLCMKGNLTRDEIRRMSDMLIKKYWPRFAELIPAAYREAEDEQ